MSNRRTKIFQSFLICLVILIGVYGYRAFETWQVEERLTQYRAATVQEVQRAIHDSLQNNGLFPIAGIVHEAPTITKIAKDNRLKNKTLQCFPVYVEGRLQSDLATVRILDLHHCSLISRDVESESGGQIVIKSKTGEFEELFISFHLLDDEQGSFRVNLPEEKQSLSSVQRALNQLVAKPNLASREELNSVLYQLFTNARLSTVDSRVTQHFLRLLLSAVHHELSRQKVFS